jgi:hypothetical protein
MDTRYENEKLHLTEGMTLRYADEMRQPVVESTPSKDLPPPPPEKVGCFSRFTQRYPFFRTKRGIAILIIIPIVLLSGLAGLAALRRNTYGGGLLNGAVLEDWYFYGQSPPVYPSREYQQLGRLQTLALCADTIASARNRYR